MSELQLTLIAVGAVLLLAVWAFNRVQEWRWHRMARSTLGAGRPDVLLGEGLGKPADSADLQTVALREEPPFDLPERQHAGISELHDDLIEPLDGGLAQQGVDWLADEGAAPVVAAPAAPVPETVMRAAQAGAESMKSEPVDSEEGAPTLVLPPREDLVAPPDGEIEYLVTLGCSAPLTGVELWQQLARSSTPARGTRWLGRRVTDGGWCVVLPESDQRFDSLRAALLLANRSGPVSELDVERFCSLVSAVATALKLRVEFPPRAPALERAEALDAFCAEVDIVVGINVMLSSNQTVQAGRIARWAEAHGMNLGRDGAFHLRSAQGHTIWRLVNRDPRPFSHAGIGHMTVSGVTFLLDVPLVDAADQRLSPMFDAAATLARELGARVLDDNGATLGPQQLGRIATELSSLLERMAADGIPAGGVRARRLFAG